MYSSDQNIKKLYRSRKNKIAAGVFGGAGEYLRVDPVVLRIGYIVLTTLTGVIPGTIAYGAMLFIVPEEPEGESTPKVSHDTLSKALFDHPENQGK